MVYGPPDGVLNICVTFFKTILLSVSTLFNKTFILEGDFNINLLDFETSKKVQSFVNSMFEFSMMPTINKPTRATKHIATAIDNVITNCILNSDFKSAIVKTILSDHFAIILINEFIQDLNPTDDMEKCIYKRDFIIKQALFEISNKFLVIFIKLYEKYFPIRKIKIKSKRALNPWITIEMGLLSHPNKDKSSTKNS